MEAASASEEKIKALTDKARDLEDRVAELEEELRLAPGPELRHIVHIPADEIWLMPQARSPEELHEKNAWLETETAHRGWQLSPRLHIEKFGNVRGT